MIRSLDALKLATTKLRTRRIRLIITLVVMSLLFASLVFIASISTGTVNSLKSFGKEGLGSRYLVSAMPLSYIPYDNPSLLDSLRAPQAAQIAQKKALAKSLGITYDEKTDPDLPITSVQSGPSPTDVQEMINASSLDVEKALKVQNEAIPGTSVKAFEDSARQNGATNVFFSTNANYGNFGGGVQVLKDGKEDYSAEDKQSYKEPVGLDSITSLGWQQISTSLIQPFTLKGQSTAVGENGSIPIVAPYSAAQELLGLKKLPDSATTDQKLERLTTTRRDVAGKEAILCYRNEVSQSLLQKAITQQKEMTINKGKKDYTPPSLQYNLPTEACGPTTIKSDKRTTEEKKIDTNQTRFEATFGKVTEPVQGIVTVRIIGVTPDINFGASFDASSILQGIFNSNIGFGWYSPIDAFTPGTLPAIAQGGVFADKPLSNKTYYAEFASLAEAKAFIKKYTCNFDSLDQNVGFSEFMESCIGSGTPFNISPYGNNAGAIEDLQSRIWSVARFVILGVVVIAIVVMMGTLGKIIADSRRETAVFRALGAKRFDISQIYFTYTVVVSLLIAILAGIIGIIGAKVVDHIYSPAMSVNAVLTYNAADINKQFDLFGVNPLYLLIILGLIIASGLVSALIPLLTNMRRNPIRDMRDES